MFISVELPIKLAAEKNSTTLVSLLVSFQADVNGYGSDGQTALYSRDILTLAATAFGYHNLMRHLLKIGANPDLFGDYRWLPLHSVCYEIDETAVDILLEYNANPNVFSKDGWTPLMFASQKGYYSIIKKLLDAGAIDQVNEQGLSAQILAEMSKFPEIVGLFDEIHRQSPDLNDELFQLSSTSNDSGERRFAESPSPATTSESVLSSDSLEDTKEDTKNNPSLPSESTFDIQKSRALKFFLNVQDKPASRLAAPSQHSKPSTELESKKPHNSNIYSVATPKENDLDQSQLSCKKG